MDPTDANAPIPINLVKFIILENEAPKIMDIDSGSKIIEHYLIKYQFFDFEDNLVHETYDKNFTIGTKSKLLRINCDLTLFQVWIGDKILYQSENVLFSWIKCLCEKDIKDRLNCHQFAFYSFNFKMVPKGREISSRIIEFHEYRKMEVGDYIMFLSTITNGDNSHSAIYIGKNSLGQELFLGKMFNGPVIISKRDSIDKVLNCKSLLYRTDKMELTK